MTILRTGILLVLLGLTHAAKLQDADHNKKGYCFAYLDSAHKDWCWLTKHGKSDYVKEPVCYTYNGYDSGDYCEGAAAKKVTHEAKTHTGMSSGQTLNGATHNSKGFCYAYTDSDQKKWCWLTSDGLKTYVKEGTGGHACESYDGYQEKDYCEDAKKNVVTHEQSGHNAPAPAFAAAPQCPNGVPPCLAAGAATEWCCPASWSTSAHPSVPDDTPDAKAFIALNNVYRCMHNVGPVQWDDDVYGGPTGAKSWSQTTNSFRRRGMKHSVSGKTRPGTDGENLAGTFKLSKHRGVDATNNWYSEIDDPCHYNTDCYQSGKVDGTGHFTAMIWQSISKIAYSNTNTELSVGRYRGCDNKPPNYNSRYKENVPPPVRNWDECVSKVQQCPAFSDVNFAPDSWGADGIEGCRRGTKSVANQRDSHGNWIWHSFMKYTMKDSQTCGQKYANIVSKVNRLYDTPQVAEPLMANPWPLAVVSGLVFAAAVVMVVLRRSRASVAVREFHQVGLDEVEGGPQMQDTSLLAETGALLPSEDGSKLGPVE